MIGKKKGRNQEEEEKQVEESQEEKDLLDDQSLDEEYKLELDENEIEDIMPDVLEMDLNEILKKDKYDTEKEIEENVFIDNLPKEETAIKIMVKDVNKHIRDLERKFFEEEDSEEEVKLENELKDP